MRWLGAFLPLVLLVIVAAIYAGSTDNDRLSEEAVAIWDNPAVTQPGWTGIALGRYYEMETESRPVVRPVATLAHRVEFDAFHQDRRGYQWTLILIHGLTAVLLFALLWVQFGSPITAFAGSALFATHPALSGSVLVLTGVSESLALFWGLLALLATGYALRSSEAGAHRSWTSLAIVWVALLIAIWCKETALVLVPTLLFWAWASRSASDSGRSRSSSETRTTAPRISSAALLATGVVSVAVIVLAHRLVSWGALPSASGAPAIMPDSGEPWSRRFLLGLAALPTYLRLVIYPGKLAVFYDFVHAWNGTGLVVRLVGGAIGVVALSSGLVLAVKRRSERAALWFGLTLFGTIAALGFVAPVGDYLSERMIYFVLPGLVGLLLLFHRQLIAPRGDLWSAAAFVLAILVAGAFGARTLVRERDYLNHDTLIEKQRKDYPESAFAEFELGNRDLTRGQFAAARARYERATEIRPELWMAWVNMGAAYSREKELGLARRAYQHAIEGIGDNPAWATAAARAHYNRALILMRQNLNTEAVRDLEQTLEIFPNHLPAHANLALIYRNNPKYDELALEHYRRAYELDPDPERRQTLLESIEYIAERAAQLEADRQRRRDAGLLPDDEEGPESLLTAP